MILAIIVNANQTNWDVMLFTTLWAYRTTYKVSIQYTPFELVYGTQPMMPVEYLVTIQRIRDVFNDDIEAAIHVRMDDLVHLDEKCWQVRKNMNHV
jgi:hypothetical protein